ncbi:hypothetical protein, partial [Deinococcus sp.]|uniref:hypothetical protein n=1 Tax=Deinococcus sp. TaxID=47478 RepID=UPI002869B05C
GSLWSELQKAGVTLQGLPAAPTQHQPGPGPPLRLNPDADHSSGFVNRTFIRDYASGRTFLDLNAVVMAVTAAGIDVHVEGWQNPTLHLGSVSLTLGTPDHPLDAYNLYDTALRPLALTLGLGSQRSSRMDDMSVYSHHTVSAEATPGTLYALASVRRLSRGLARGDAVVLAYDLAQVDAGGRLHFRLAYDLAHLILSADTADLRADADWLRTAPDEAALTYATPTHPGHALLLRLSGQLGGQTYRVVPQSGSSVGDQY